MLTEVGKDAEKSLRNCTPAVTDLDLCTCEDFATVIKYCTIKASPQTDSKRQAHQRTQ